MMKNSKIIMIRTCIKEELKSIEDVYGKVLVKDALKVTLLRILMMLVGMLLPFVIAIINVSVWPFIIGTLIIETILIRAMFVRGSSNEHAIAIMAKKNPNDYIKQIIESNMIEGTEVIKRKTAMTALWIIPVATAFVLLGLSGGGFKTRTLYKLQDEGYELVLHRQGFFDKEKEFEIPAEYMGKPVVSIKEKALKNNKKIETVIVPDTVTYMGSFVFENCSNLQNVKLSENLKVMGGAVFKNCTALTRIELPDSLKELRGETFYNCKSLESVKLPANIKEIKGNTFEYCESLKCIEIPDGVTRIAAHAFYGCKILSSVRVPDSVVEIGSSAFRQCENLYYIYIPRNAVVNERAFKESPTRIEYLEEENNYKRTYPYAGTQPYKY